MLSPITILTLTADLKSEDFWNEKRPSIRAELQTPLSLPPHELTIPYTEKRRSSQKTN